MKNDDSEDEDQGCTVEEVADEPVEENKESAES